MSWITALFSPKAIAETAQSAVRGLDSIVYTEQEKAEKTQAAQAMYAKLWSAAVPSAITRRIIASVIVAVWAFLILFAVIAYAIGAALATPTGENIAKFTVELLTVIVLQPMNIVVGFYFLKQIVTEYRQDAMQN